MISPAGIIPIHRLLSIVFKQQITKQGRTDGRFTSIIVYQQVDCFYFLLRHIFNLIRKKTEPLDLLTAAVSNMFPSNPFLGRFSTVIGFFFKFFIPMTTLDWVVGAFLELVSYCRWLQFVDLPCCLLRQYLPCPLPAIKYEPF